MSVGLPDVEVIEDAQQLDSVLDKAIQDSGFSFDELQRQATQHSFKSEKARVAWFVISSLSA